MVAAIEMNVCLTQPGNQACGMGGQQQCDFDHHCQQAQHDHDHHHHHHCDNDDNNNNNNACQPQQNSAAGEIGQIASQLLGGFMKMMGGGIGV